MKRSIHQYCEQSLCSSAVNCKDVNSALLTFFSKLTSSMSRTRLKLRAAVSVRGGYSVRYTRSSLSTTCMYTLLMVSDTTTHGSYARIRSYTVRSVFRFRKESSLMFRRVRSEPEPFRAMLVPDQSGTSAPTLTPGRWPTAVFHPLGLWLHVEENAGQVVVLIPSLSHTHWYRWTNVVTVRRCAQLFDWLRHYGGTLLIGYRIRGYIIARQLILNQNAKEINVVIPEYINICLFCLILFVFKYLDLIMNYRLNSCLPVVFIFLGF